MINTLPIPQGFIPQNRDKYYNSLMDTTSYSIYQLQNDFANRNMELKEMNRLSRVYHMYHSALQKLYEETPIKDIKDSLFGLETQCENFVTSMENQLQGKTDLEDHLMLLDTRLQLLSMNEKDLYIEEINHGLQVLEYMKQEIPTIPLQNLVTIIPFLQKINENFDIPWMPSLLNNCGDALYRRFNRFNTLEHRYLRQYVGPITQLSIVLEDCARSCEQDVFYETSSYITSSLQTTPFYQILYELDKPRVTTPPVHLKDVLSTCQLSLYDEKHPFSHNNFIYQKMEKDLKLIQRRADEIVLTPQINFGHIIPQKHYDNSVTANDWMNLAETNLKTITNLYKQRG